MHHTLILTVAIVLGLALGFYRELQLIDQFGISSELDAFLVALFIPEAVRLVFNGGVLSSAWMPLWLSCKTPDDRNRWSGLHTQYLLLICSLLAVVLFFSAKWVVFSIGPGLSDHSLQLAQGIFQTLVALLPLIALHAMLSLVHQSGQRFLLQGMGGVFFNLPVVGYLIWVEQARIDILPYLFLLGGVLMVLPLLPFAWSQSWRPVTNHVDSSTIGASFRKLLVVSASGFSSQLVLWAERIILSFIGEGYIAMINLIRKLTNILSVVLLSAGQVLMSRLSVDFTLGHVQMKKTFSTGGFYLFALTWPISFVAALYNYPILQWLPVDFSQQQVQLISQLFSGFVIAVPLGAFNMLFARWCYAQSSTLKPTLIEVGCTVFQSILLFVFFQWLGVWSIVFANLIALSLISLSFMSLGFVPKPRARVMGFVCALMLASGLVTYTVAIVEIGFALALFVSALQCTVLMLCFFLSRRYFIEN